MSQGDMSQGDMREDYLWDRSGAPDIEVARLEKLLGQLAHKEFAHKPAPSVPVRKTPRTLWWLAAAAVLIAAIAVPLATRGKPSDWRYSTSNEQAKGIRTGHLIQTGDKQEVTLESRSTGELQVDANSRLRLVAADNQQRFKLEQGTIHALIWAPPGRFVVDTPAARTVDLGCRYTLHMEKDGVGLLTVDMGWVAFEWKGLESFIPAGAACKTRPNRGPGTPWFTDASPELRAALEQYDEKPGSETLTKALALARPKDAMTVWHLMTRSKGEARGQAYDALAKLAPIASVTTRDAILRGETPAIDAAWNALDLGAVEIWRNWKRTY